MLCNLAEDMLSNWAEARIAVHSMKTKIVEIDAQLTAMDKTFSWKGTTSISSGGAQGGGASGSEMSVRAITSLGGNDSATGGSSKMPHAKPFSVPSTVEPFFKRQKGSSTPQT